MKNKKLITYISSILSMIFIMIIFVEYSEGAKQPVGTISGSVMHADGKTPVSGAKLIVYKNKKIVEVSETKKDGTYNLSDLAIGGYDIIIFPDESINNISKSVVVKEGENKINFLSPNTGSVSGMINSEDNKPITGADIFVFGQTNKKQKKKITSNGKYGTFETQKDGLFTINNLLPGMYGILVTAPDYMEQVKSNISIKPSQITNVKFILKSGGLISGKVTHIDGKTPAAGIKLVAVESKGEFSGDSTTDTEGNYVINGLIEGKYDVIMDKYLMDS